MKINGEFIKRDIAGETIFVPIGSTALHFNGICSANETADLIFELLLKGTSKEEIINVIVSNYDVNSESAEKDLEDLLSKLKNQSLLVE